MEMQALIEEIAALVQKVKDGTATLGELEAFAAATQQLNERAIVLRYKAYEAKIYSTSPSLNDLETSNNPAEETEKEEEVIAFTTEATSIAEESEDLSFDLFSMDDDSQQNEIEEEIEPEELPIVAEKTEEIAEPIVEEPEEAFFEEEVPTIIEDIPVEPELVIETPVVPTPAPATGGGEHPLIRKARTDDGSMQSRLLAVRLETLKNAFGLNERMLIVRELFGGSNEAYSEAIESLDNQSEINHARAKVSDYANQYGWKEDNELAVEFVQKVERRYV